MASGREDVEELSPSIRHDALGFAVQRLGEWVTRAVSGIFMTRRRKGIEPTTSRDGSGRTRRQRVVSICIEPPEAEWVDALVNLLKQEGHPKPARSGVVRLALLGLQEMIAGRSRAEIFTFCVERERDRLLGLLNRTIPQLPARDKGAVRRPLPPRGARRRRR